MNRKKSNKGQSNKQKSSYIKVSGSGGALKFEQLNPSEGKTYYSELIPDKTDKHDWMLYIMISLVVVMSLTIFILLFGPRSDFNLENGQQAEQLKHSKAKLTLPTEDNTMSDEFVHSGISCKKLMENAKKILDTRPLKEWEGALDLLATCAIREPDNAAPRWNLAVALLKMDRGEEAIGFIDEALSLDPTNTDYLKTGGAFLSKHGYHSEVVRCLEYYLEVTLHVPKWEELLASISILREDEWSFLYDAGDDIVQVLEMLQTSYLKTTSLIKAGYLYKVLIGLKGENVELELIGAYSSFAFGLGDVSTGIKYLRKYTEKQYVAQGYGNVGQAYEVVTAHSLRLFTAGLDSTLNSIVKNLLSGGGPVWEELVYNCELQESHLLNYSVRVRQSDIRKILIKCILVQGTIDQLVSDGAVLYAENIFGWTPVLHAAALDSPDIIKQFLELDPDPQARTVLAQTALHIAAIRGSYSIVEPMLRAGLKVNNKDYFNRTALQVACLQRWSSKGMARALGQKLPQGCPNKTIYSPPHKLHLQGGWLGSGLNLPKELTKERCDIDVMAEPDIESFVFDYLSLQRPVLIRNATNNQEMKTLYQIWQRNKFELEYRGLKFNEVEVPYAEAFGYTTSKQTTIKKFMAKMRKLSQEQREVKRVEDFLSPTYIFETIPPNSPILKDFKLPSFLDPEITNIESSKHQFYLGPPLSGAPVHFHRNAWNILIYGQKRWFLYPPEKAFYSKQHVWDWWRENRGVGDREWAGPPPLECVQYPGDMMYVPDMWGHAVINLKESVGLASEFVYGSSEFSI